MILENILEIKKAEENAAESKAETKVKTKKILASAEDNGKKYYENAISSANKTISDDEKKAADTADKILERAAGDAKIKTDAIKLDAASNTDAAISMIISNIYKI